MKQSFMLILLSLFFVITAVAGGADERKSGEPGESAGKESFSQTGHASWYGGKFQGRKTASGEVFDTNKLTAAHKRLPFGTRIRVTNTANDKSVVVRINDRGPFVKGRIIDLSRAAAARIGMLGSGVAEVEIEVVSSESAQPDDELPLPKPPSKKDMELTREVEESSDDARENPIYTFPEPASYTIQIASFADRNNAKNLHASLRKAGLDPSYEKSSSGYYRVVIAGIDPERLEQVKRRLAELGHTSVLVKEKL